MARSNPTCIPAIPVVPKDFDREQWLESPECIRCFRSMSLNDGCEWPDDPRLLLCSDCSSGALETALRAIDGHEAEIQRIQDHKDEEISDLRSEISSLEAKIEALNEADRA